LNLAKILLYLTHKTSALVQALNDVLAKYKRMIHSKMMRNHLLDTKKDMNGDDRCYYGYCDRYLAK